MTCVMSNIRGKKADYQANLSTLTIKTKPQALAQYGIDAQTVLDVVSSLGGYQVGQIFEGRARYPIMVRVPEQWRENLTLLEQVPVADSNGKAVPLKELADIRLEETPPTIEHEGNRRRTFISANVRGRDVATFVTEAQKAVAEKVEFAPGYEVKWGGDFENLQSASKRLAIITPVVLMIIMLLLHTSLGSMRLALLIFLSGKLKSMTTTSGLASRKSCSPSIPVFAVNTEMVSLVKARSKALQMDASSSMTNRVCMTPLYVQPHRGQRSWRSIVRSGNIRRRSATPT